MWEKWFCIFFGDKKRGSFDLKQFEKQTGFDYWFCCGKEWSSNILMCVLVRVNVTIIFVWCVCVFCFLWKVKTRCHLSPVDFGLCCWRPFSSWSILKNIVCIGEIFVFSFCASKHVMTIYLPSTHCFSYQCFNSFCTNLEKEFKKKIYYVEMLNTVCRKKYIVI